MGILKPEHTLTDNVYGTIFMGPAGDTKTNPDTNFVRSLKNGNIEMHTNKGNKSEIVQGTNHEIVVGTQPGDNRKKKEKENVSKSITVKEGDITIIAENGNIKLKGKNVFIETTGDGNDGSFMVKANEAITMVSGEQMTLGGAKVCISTPDAITLNAGGVIYLLCKDLNKGGPLSGLLSTFVPGPLAKLIDGILLSCK
jgi:hypothetical protein